MLSRTITVEGLAKAYRLGLRDEIPDTFVGAMSSWMKAPLRNWRRLKRLNTFNEPAASTLDVPDPAVSRNCVRPSADLIWALRDVSFEVDEGDAVAIIGRNGAGKSTLLKVLSRITEPTAGRAFVRGRLSSLLEVGTGFHPELTGRENIYMNGTLLGMRKREIDRRFDEIVDFSGVERFLDTPIKRYSSGMQVRLAFSVAAHLEPEVLIVDEVLAVGDIGFQKKCLDRMNAIAQERRTILFVSHNLSAVRRLCTRGIVIDSGRVTMDGDIDEAIAAYTQSMSAEMELGQASLRNRLDRANGDVRFTSIRFERPDGRECLCFQPGETVCLRMECEAHATTQGLAVHLQLRPEASAEQLTSLSALISESTIRSGDRHSFTLTLPSVPLRPGDYRLYICLGAPTWRRFYDIIDDNVGLPRLSIRSDEAFGDRLPGYFSIPWTLNVHD